MWLRGYHVTPELKFRLQKSKLIDVITKYTMGEDDKFSAIRYPEVTSEIEGLQKSLVAFDNAYKADIVISMLKDHSIKTEWLADNKRLTKLLASGSLATSHIESLFNSSRHNRKFTTGLERNIMINFGQLTTNAGD